ncbi:MAG: hypothetical protein MI923_26585 [Phycisphaerales bacterium]|nr:hypothetical protein [Phycisphaerales bacterium]
MATIPFLLGPIAVKSMLTLSARPEFTVISPEDGRFPPEAMFFFRDVYEQMQPIGFELATYLVNPDTIPNMTGYLAVFENESAQDTAAAMVVVTKIGAPATMAFVIEFCTSYTDGMSVSTNNSHDPECLFQLPWKRMWKFPAMKDLGLLYQIHQAHMIREGGSTKKKNPIPDEWPSYLVATALREYKAQTDVGCLKTIDQGQAFGVTLIGALYGSWGMTWPISAIRRARIRKKARTLLAELDLPVHYETINYKSRTNEQTAGPPQLPMPRSGVPQARPINDLSTFSCPCCEGTIATYASPGNQVVCPICRQDVITPTLL